MVVNDTLLREQLSKSLSVFLTGHTGFKGSWLALWLYEMGVCVTGYALPPDGRCNLFTMAEIENLLVGHYAADIRDFDTLVEAMHQAEPELLIHMAAQSLVGRAYHGTFKYVDQ